jgi:hypothetical protein
MVMTRRDLPDFAELWKEQVEPAELAELKALATTIRRTAKRRKQLDNAMGLLCLGLVPLLLLVHPAPLWTKLGFIAFMGAPMAWAGWMRYRLADAARALVADHPSTFFEAAIENARAERNFYMIATAVTTPILVAGILLFYAANGVTSLDLIREDVFERRFVKTMVYGGIYIVAFAFILHANLKRHRQVRRLQAMRREWQEQEARDLAESDDEGTLPSPPPPPR